MSADVHYLHSALQIYGVYALLISFSFVSIIGHRFHLFLIVMVLHLSLHVRQKEYSSNDHQNNRKPAQLSRQPVLLCILIGCSCIFQGQCTLISISTEEPQATKATVRITKAKHLSQPSVFQVWFSLKHCLGQIVCASLIVRDSSVSSRQLVQTMETVAVRQTCNMST